MKIAIFGLARSGMSVYKYLKTQADIEVVLVNQGEPETWSVYEDIKDDNAQLVGQDDAEVLLAKMDKIILSPGIPREHKSLRLALNRGIPVLSEIEFAFTHSDIPVIGITGTNGKTTTTTMIGEALSKFNLDVFICGNIGRPYSDILLETKDYDYAIVELSSFQLESIVDFHPHIALILNITENHTERYTDFEDYKKAKFEITKNQNLNDYLLTNEIINSKAQVLPIKDLEGFDFRKSKLIGEHNKKNFYCAYKVCEILKLPRLDLTFQEFIDSFRGVEYRLQFIKESKNLSFYNDAKSTNDEATLAAISSFDSKSKLHLILGGKLRSEKVYIQDKLDLENIETLYVFGEAKEVLKQNLKHKNIRVFENISEVLMDIKSSCLEGIVLFSPAFPSFDQYKDYMARGEDFTKKVNDLFF